SGFGFGGINAHVLVEEWIPGARDGTRMNADGADSRGSDEERIGANPPHPRSSAFHSSDPIPIAIVGMSAHFGPFRGLRAYQERVLGGAIESAPAAPGNW